MKETIIGAREVLDKLHKHNKCVARKNLYHVKHRNIARRNKICTSCFKRKAKPGRSLCVKCSRRRK